MFDPTFHSRRDTPAIKWAHLPPEVIPLTIADMEFACPLPVLEALRARLDHPILGYEFTAETALNDLPEFYRRRFGCRVPREWLVPVPAVMPGLYRACALAGGAVMYCTPIYNNIRTTGEILSQTTVEVPMKAENGIYRMDWEAMEQAVTPEVKSFVLCSPHNPVGRVFTREELQQVIAFCQKHHLLLVSDEIHCEFAFDRPHTPMFTLSPESITLTSPGKTCNIPKCSFGVAIIPDPELRRKYTGGMYRMFPQPNIPDGAAFAAAYSPACDGWKDEMLAYLKENRDYLEAQLPGVFHAEGTYLAWMDLGKSPEELEQKAKVRLGRGESYMDGAGTLVRMNFACPREILAEAIERIRRILS